MITPRVPLTMISSSSSSRSRTWCRPTTAGIFRLRATIAVWLVGPPTSVTKPAMLWSRKPMVSAGDRSWATTMVPSPSRRLGRQAAGVAKQHLDQALDHLHHVGLALAQVGVLDLAELLDQVLHLLHQRPFGVAAALGDELARGVDQHRVGQHHQLQVDEGADLAVRLAGGGDRLQPDQLALHAGDGLVQTGALFFQVPGATW